MIKTKRLLLRPARMEDLGAVHRFRSSQDVALYLPDAAATALDQTREWLSNMIANRFEEGEDYLIDLNGTIIGKVGAYRLPEIGYMLHPDYWGHGYASEALCGFLVHLTRTRPDITELIADVDPRNDRSLAMLRRLGFEESELIPRTIETHLGWCDSIYFKIGRAAMLALDNDVSLRPD
jgi:[ribosomal protein S5]-alanine N-acetyltransferase